MKIWEIRTRGLELEPKKIGLRLDAHSCTAKLYPAILIKYAIER